MAAGVSVVSVAARFPVRIGGGIIDPGGWDTHGSNFKLLRAKLPIYDQAVYALIEDLHTRGLHEEDVAVVVWGEFGARRASAIRRRTVAATGSGRSCPAGGRRYEDGPGPRRNRPSRRESAGRPFTPQQVLATLYHVLGIDPTTTLPDFNGRPQYLLDHPEKIAAPI